MPLSLKDIIMKQYKYAGDPYTVCIRAQSKYNGDEYEWSPKVLSLEIHEHEYSLSALEMYKYEYSHCTMHVDA